MYKHQFLEKGKLGTLLFCAIILAHYSNSQSGNSASFSGGGSIGSTKTWDSIPSSILSRISNFLESRGLNEEYEIANFKGERYFLMIPLKQKENVNLIWSDYHFNGEGECVRIVTKISNIDDIDCSILGNELCGSILRLTNGYLKEFGVAYDDIIYVNEIGQQLYFEVFHPDFNEQKKVKFDFQGNIIYQK